MPVIYLETKINAEIEIVFDLSRSIDFHTITTSKTNEQAIAGKTTGLIEMGETVTWRARHFGIFQELTSKIVGFQRPTYFSDEMVKGAFKHFKHEHFFYRTSSGTLLKDKFAYESPFHFLGRFADRLFLERYMTNFLLDRNKMIKDYAESYQWKSILER